MIERAEHELLLHVGPTGDIPILTPAFHLEHHLARYLEQLCVVAVSACRVAHQFQREASWDSIRQLLVRLLFSVEV